MANKDHTPSNLFHLAASCSDLVRSEDAEWNALMAKWLRLDALARANVIFGPMGKAMDAYRLKEAVLDGKYGKNWRRNPQAMAEFEAVSDMVDHEVDAIASEFFDPASDAAAELAMRPAPNIAAALFKIELCKREELHRNIMFPGEAWQIVTEDMARLAA